MKSIRPYEVRDNRSFYTLVCGKRYVRPSVEEVIKKWVCVIVGIYDLFSIFTVAFCGVYDMMKIIIVFFNLFLLFCI